MTDHRAEQGATDEAICGARLNHWPCTKKPGHDGVHFAPFPRFGGEAWPVMKIMNGALTW